MSGGGFYGHPTGYPIIGFAEQQMIMVIPATPMKLAKRPLDDTKPIWQRLNETPRSPKKRR